jgi:CRP-like cAMP-binding protein
MLEISEKLRYLRTVDIFQDLAPGEVEEIDRAITMTTCRAGRVFYAPDESTEVLFILKKGRVQLYRLTPDGKKLVFGTVEPGAVFGEMAVIGQGMQNSFAEAVDDCLLCVMSRQDVERLILSKPVVGLRIIERLADRLREAEAKLEELAFKSVPARLASLLLHLHTEQGDLIAGYTHQDLADAIGATRETVTQVLTELRGRQMLAVGRKQITILDLSGLVQLASG